MRQIFKTSFVTLLISCSASSNNYANKSLQGTWVQQVSPANTKIFSRLTDFKFVKDSVYLKLTATSSETYEIDSCPHRRYSEYAKGTYRITNDSLLITGVYTHANYRMKVSGCYRNGYLSFNYRILSAGLNQMKLRNAKEHGIIELNRTPPVLPASD